MNTMWALDPSHSVREAVWSSSTIEPTRRKTIADRAKSEQLFTNGMSAQEEGDRPGLRAKLLTSVAILATLGCGLALTVWKVDAPPAALLRGPYRRPQQAAQPDPPPLDAETLTSIAEEASWTATWALPEGAPMSLGMSQAVGPWKAGDPWPGGVVCPNGKLTDAFHLKPEVDCEPNCVECTMVCLPSAYVGPFEKRGGQLGSSCFERGCTAYKGSGSQMGVSFHTYACDPALQAEWYEKNAPLSEEGAKQNLAECLAACRRRDKPCRLQCEADHKDVRGDRARARPWPHRLAPGRKRARLLAASRSASAAPTPSPPLPPLSPPFTAPAHHAPPAARPAPEFRRSSRRSRCGSTRPLASWASTLTPTRPRPPWASLSSARPASASAAVSPSTRTTRARPRVRAESPPRARSCRRHWCALRP